MEPNKNQGKNFWNTLSQEQSYISWSGFNFETICLKHIDHLKKALGITGIHSENSCWRNENSQIDLIIDRADKWTNIIEIKFRKDAYTIDKTEYLNLRKKMDEFKRNTNNKKHISLCVVSTFGVSENEYANELVENNLTIDVLFENI